MKTFRLLLFLLTGSVVLHSQTVEKSIKVVNKIHLPGDAGWDYLYSDDQAGRLYVSHGTMFLIVDEAKDQLVGTIEGLKGVHGVAIDHELNKGYISDGRDTLIVVFDTRSLKLLNRIRVTGVNPDAILYDSFSKKVFAFNGRTKNATVLDAVSDKVIATIPLAGKPEFAVSDGKGSIFVNIEDLSKLCKINAATLKVEQTWSLAPGEGPSGLAFDKEKQRLFSVCDNQIMAISDAKTGKVIASVPIGKGVDGVAFDTGLKQAYSANGEGTVTVVKEISKNVYTAITVVSTQKSARTIAVNELTHHIYLPAADYESVENGKGRPKMVPGSFVVLNLAPVK